MDDDEGLAVIDAGEGTPLPTLFTLRTDLHDPERRADVESCLASIPGVLGARIVAGFEREVDELHVVTTLDRAPKQTVRDVQTLLMARFGVTTDHRVVSVVQLDEDPEAVIDPPGPAFVPRITVGRITVTHAGPEAHIEVTLRRTGEILTGQAEGNDTAAGRRAAVGRATLAALAPVLGDSKAVELRGCEVVELLDHRIALTVVQLRTPQGERTVSGSALVRDATADAVVRSVLDALNRTADAGAH
ncbi:MAG: hypothetical protein WEB03_06030 [Nitriliruptor sp.]|uniref:hypothetical protein n=1 Tax=Nitriliruptor sp. TaxID=2448056 RepID=UPI00349FFBD3